MSATSHQSSQTTSYLSTVEAQATLFESLSGYVWVQNVWLPFDWIRAPDQSICWLFERSSNPIWKDVAESRHIDPYPLT